MINTDQTPVLPWVMPDWMKPIEVAGCFQNTGGYTVTELMNLGHNGGNNTQTNILLAGMIVSVSAQIDMLHRLHAQGFLQCSMQELEREIGHWAEQTFPDQTDQSVTAHLVEEANELNDRSMASLKPGGVPITWLADGIADVMILAMCLAWRAGLSSTLAARQKMITNRGRTWAFDPEAGYHRHVD